MQQSRAGVIEQAVIAYSEGKKERAIELCDRGIQEKPNLAPLLHLRGVLYFEQGQYREAVQLVERAIGCGGGVAEYHNSLGAAFKKLGENDKALKAYQEALGLRPDFAEACNNLGELLYDQERFSEAQTYYRRALSFNRSYPDALYNLGNVLKRQGHLQEALDNFNTCLTLEPGYRDCRWNRGLTHLMLGNYPQGFEDYEERFHQDHFPSRRLDLGGARWRGEPIGGKRILVYCEQGYGDTFQFMRFVPRLVELGADVVLECPPRLRCLLGTMNVPVKLVSDGKSEDGVDYHAPLMSLPYLYEVESAGIVANSPYFTVPSEIQHRVRERFKGRFDPGKKRVGIQWQGDPTFVDDQHRSIGLVHWLELLRQEEIEWVSLQKGHGLEQLNGESLSNVINAGIELDEGDDGFIETAALMKDLDLVITSDTSVAHLAGALGCPCWVLLGEHPDWRWGMMGSTTLWYRHMTPF